MIEIKVLFICHGNICRSPMAEYIMKHELKKRALDSQIYVSSKATSTEEIGNDIYPNAKSVLKEHNIDFSRHYATQVTKSDYEKYDYLIVMDEYNLYNLKRIVGSDNQNKIYKLLSFAKKHYGDISDPWYNGRFENTYQEISDGCDGLIEYLLRNHY